MPSLPSLIAILGLTVALALPVSAQEPVTPDPTERPAAAAEKSAAKKKEPAGPTLPEQWVGAFQWRSIGPANMGGRVTDLAVYAKDSTRYWVATASGGLLKTANNGITFEYQFQKEGTSSIGAVAVAQSNPEIVWVGTGESNPRNSVSWGDGVYKSTDGGGTWKRMGLEESFQIGRIAIHPENPDIVYVGALGRLWGPNDERGLYKTEDGGENWTRVLGVDENTGVVEVQMHPGDPETLIVATYERRRDLFCTNDPSQKHGAGSGLHKTTDGGATWKKLTEGLPTVKLGRIGVDYYRKDPNVVYIVLESEEIGKGPKNAAWVGVTGEDADAGARVRSVTKDSPGQKAGLKKGDIILAIDGKTVLSNAALTLEIGKRRAEDEIKVEFSRDREKQAVNIVCAKRPERSQSGRGNARARTPRRRFGGRLGGQRENIQELQGDMGVETGGVYRSEDGGESWTRVNSCNPRPMYFSQIRVDPSDEKKVYVLGVSLYRTHDGGKKFTGDHARRGVHVDHHAMWIDPKNSKHHLLGNDGGIYVTYDRGANWDHLNHVALGQFYHVTVGPRRNYRVYGGLQDNGSWGGPSRVSNGGGPINEDWIRVGSGDGFICRVDPEDADQIYFESQNGSLGRIHLRTGERGRMRPGSTRGRGRPPGVAGGREGRRSAAPQQRGRGTPGQQRQRYRFNWKTPYILSSHNSRIYYAAGNHVFRSLDRGNSLKKISPEITAGKKGSATALAESPRDSSVLYVGTDDGGFWGTRDGGHTWIDLFERAAAPTAIAKADEKSEQTGETTAAATETPDAQRPARSAEGTRRAGGRGRFLDRLKKSDANGDGKIQREEMPEEMARMFDRLDANEDDVIDADELKAAGERRGRGGRRRGGRGGEGSGRPARSQATNGEAAAPDPAPRDKPASKGKSISALLPGRRYVSSIEPSRFEAGLVYVTFDGHRSDDDAPHVFVSEDHGTTWRSLVSNLPVSAGSTKVIREDLKNRNLLYLGTEFGAWVSIDRGESWTRMNSNLPTVPVHDFAIHPTAGEIVAATHGRSLWVLDVTALRQITAERVAGGVTLYKPNDAIIWRRSPRRGGGLRRFEGQNPASGATVHFSLARDPGEITLEIQDQAGKTVRKLKVEAKAGLNAVRWDLRQEPRQRRRGSMPRSQRFRFGRRGGRQVAPGTYKVVLTVDGETSSQGIKVITDPDHPTGDWLGFQLQDEEEHLEEQEEGMEEGRDG